MKNSEKYLEAYERVRVALIKKTGKPKETQFGQLVEFASYTDTVVKRHKGELADYGFLRNAIVHRGVNGHIFAEPCDEAVASLRSIADLLTAPPRVIPTLKCDVLSFSPADSIGKVVTEMQRQSYSQVPVVKENGAVTGLLTADTIVRWLADQVHEDILILSDTPLSKVLKSADPDPKNAAHHRFMARNESLFAVLEWFEEELHLGRRLDAILITENGKNGESLLGIATVWDIPRVLRLTKVKGQPGS